MATQVSVLEWGQRFRLKEKQRKLWREIGERILSLPKEQQDIILEDFLTAIKSRLLVMERVNSANSALRNVKESGAVEKLSRTKVGPK